MTIRKTPKSKSITYPLAEASSTSMLNQLDRLHTDG